LISADAQIERVQAFYDRWTPAFVAGYGTTLQAGFAKPDADSPADPDASAVVLASRAGVRDGDRILDAGCGVGGPALAIAAAHPRASVHGVTVSRAQAGIGRRLIAEADLAARVTITQADFHELPFADASFDVVLFLESCGYSAAREALFAEAARVVRPGGQVYVKDVFVRSGPLTESEARSMAAFDDLWQLASSPTLSGVTDDLAAAGCAVVTAGAVPNVDSDRFVAAMVEPDPETIFRLSELGRAFALSGADCPTFFGEVRARRATE
jgi:cyclopropane fatty-acyl-phospholipid synthase-like methyltransferase